MAAITSSPVRTLLLTTLLLISFAGTGQARIPLDAADSSSAIDIQVFFQVDMSVQESLGNFDPANDLVVVRGNNPGTGNWSGATLLTEDQSQPGVYNDWILLTELLPGDTVLYNFVILLDGDPNDAKWENLPDSSFPPDSNRVLDSITGEEPDTDDPPDGIGNIELPVSYFSDAVASDFLTQEKAVTFQVDVRLAYWKIADPDSIIIDLTTCEIVLRFDSVNVAGDFNNWPWANFTDPTHNASDTDGDSIWVTTITLPTGTARNFIYKYGLNGYDVEAGFGEHHEILLVDDGRDTSVADVFGYPGTLYDPYIRVFYGVREYTDGLPSEFALEQNYPNPFNPSTSIVFSLPTPGMTMIRVYNLVGQQVAQQDLGHLNAGRFEMILDGSNLASGLYFYRLESGNFTATKKMILMK